MLAIASRSIGYRSEGRRGSMHECSASSAERGGKTVKRLRYDAAKSWIENSALVEIARERRMSPTIAPAAAEGRSQLLPALYRGASRLVADHPAGPGRPPSISSRRTSSLRRWL